MSVSTTITESGELPFTAGTLEVDSSNGAITIFMRPAPPHEEDECLIISKTSNDKNMISLFSESTLINGGDIVLFGLPPSAKTNKAKARTLYLKSDGTNWKIIHKQ